MATRLQTSNMLCHAHSQRWKIHSETFVSSRPWTSRTQDSKQRYLATPATSEDSEMYFTSHERNQTEEGKWRVWAEVIVSWTNCFLTAKRSMLHRIVAFVSWNGKCISYSLLKGRVRNCERWESSSAEEQVLYCSERNCWQVKCGRTVKLEGKKTPNLSTTMKTDFPELVWSVLSLSSVQTYKLTSHIYVHFSSVQYQLPKSKQ